MKRQIILRLISITLAIIGLTSVSIISHAQSNEQFELPIPENAVWEIVESAMKECELPGLSINRNTQTATSAYYNFTSLMIQNRLQYQFVYQNGTLKVSFTEKQYLSDQGWVNNPLPMTKKQADKLLNPLQEALKQGAMAHSASTPKEITHKKGIFKSFAISKTGNNQMDLLVISESGELLGIKLGDGQSRIEWITYQASVQADPVVFLFDENNLPKAIVSKDLIGDIIQVTGQQYTLLAYDHSGKFLKEYAISIPSPSHGGVPHSTPEIKKGPNTLDDPLLQASETAFGLLDLLKGASFAMKTISCAALAQVGSCVSLAIDGILALSDEDAFYYNELEFIQGMVDYLSFSAPKSVFEKSETLINGLKDAVEAAQNLLNSVKRTPPTPEHPKPSPVTPKSSEPYSPDTKAPTAPPGNELPPIPAAQLMKQRYVFVNPLEMPDFQSFGNEKYTWNTVCQCFIKTMDSRTYLKFDLNTFTYEDLIKHASEGYRTQFLMSFVPVPVLEYRPELKPEIKIETIKASEVRNSNGEILSTFENLLNQWGKKGYRVELLVENRKLGGSNPDPDVTIILQKELATNIQYEYKIYWGETLEKTSFFTQSASEGWLPMAPSYLMWKNPIVFYRVIGKNYRYKTSIISTPSFTSSTQGKAFSEGVKKSIEYSNSTVADFELNNPGTLILKGIKRELGNKQVCIDYIFVH